MKKIVFYVIGGIALFAVWGMSGQIGRFIGRPAVENYDQRKQEDAVEKAIELAVHELRKQLPMQIDEATSLKNVASAQNEFIYYYHLSYVKSDLNLNDFYNRMTGNLISDVCQQRDMRQMMDMGVEYRYVYMSADGLLVDEITIRASDC